MEAEEFLSGIQKQIEARTSSVAEQVSAIQFFPPAYPGTIQATLCETPDHDVRPRDFISGHGDWQQCDTLEGRRAGEAMSLILARLKELGSEMQVTLDQIGGVPANPGTVRGAIGSWIILILRRLFWWQTRSVSAFADTVTRELKEQVALLEHITKAQEENQRTLLSIQQTLARMGPQLQEFDKQGRQLACRTSQLESNVSDTAELTAMVAAELDALSTTAGSLAKAANCAELRESERPPGVEGGETMCRHENL